MSWKPEVQVSGESGWHRNGCTFATETEAQKYAKDLFNRWTLTTAHRAVEVDSTEFPVNYRWDEASGHAQPIN